MYLKLLEDFVCLANLKSFTAASRERNISQSALSRRVKSLEQWLGAQLIDRDSKQFSLTSQGRIFFPEAEAILRKIYNLREAVRAVDMSEDLEIAVASQNSITQTLFPDWVKLLESRLGHIYVRLVSEKLNVCIDLFNRGEVNYLFCYSHDSWTLPLDEKKFSYCTIGKENLIPVSAPADDKALFSLPGSTKDPIPYVAYTHSSLFGKAVDQLIQLNSHRCFLSRRYENAYSHILKSLVRENLGLAWLPESSIGSELRSRELCRAGDKNWDIELDIRFYYHKQPKSELEKAILNISNEMADDVKSVPAQSVVHVLNTFK